VEKRTGFKVCFQMGQLVPLQRGASHLNGKEGTVLSIVPNNPGGPCASKTVATRWVSLDIAYAMRSLPLF
jgi:hypothetical protein